MLLVFLITTVSAPSDLPYAIDQVLPPILSPLLVLAVYFMTQEITSNRFTSIFAAFLTVVSVQLLAGIFAGFFSNWIGLIIGYAAVGFLFRSLKKLGNSNFIFFFICMNVLLLAHTYTWTVFVLVMVLFLLILLKLGTYERKKVILLLIIISSSIFIDLSKAYLTDTQSGLQHDLRVSEITGTEIERYYTRWDSLVDTLQHFLGGLLGNSILLLLAVYWLLRCDMKQPENILLAIILSTGIIPLFFGDWIIQSRVFYIIPFQVCGDYGIHLLVGTQQT